MKSIATCLMFVGDQLGKAEEAITAYTTLFSNSEVLSVEHYTKDDAPEKEGTVKVAHFTLNDMPMMAIDSALEHRFTFTPSMSLFVECESEAEIEKAFESLSNGGSVLMPMDNYGFSKRFGWLEDRYGVSWQLNLD